MSCYMCDEPGPYPYLIKENGDLVLRTFCADHLDEVARET